MAVSNPIRIGANAALSAPAFDDLWLPVYGGEVLTRFNEYLLASKFVTRRTIASGNTAKFPRIGGIGAERHAVGSQLLGLDAEQTELSITLDERPLVSHFRLDDVDQAMSHFETRSEYSRQSGQALAEAQERYTYRLLVNASRATETSLYGGSNSSFPGGGLTGTGDAYTSAGSFPSTAAGTWTTDGIGAFLTGLDQIAVRFDEMRVPFDMRHAVLNVKGWHAMKNFGSPRSATDLNNGRIPLFQASDGTYGQNPNPSQFIPNMMDFNTPLVYNGFAIWRSNLLPNGQDLSTDDETKYQGNFTDTRGIVFQQRAVGVLTLMDVMTEIERSAERQDWLFVTKMLSGGGTLRPECAVEIKYTA